MTNAVSLAQQASTGVSQGFKNRIINGAMVIDQRNAGGSVTGGTTNQYPVDRFLVYGSQASKFTAQQNAGSVTTPVGFTNYLGCTSSSAYSVVNGDVFVIQQRIEGFNTADLQWGSGNAKTVTLSFQVYSSLTGTFGGCIRNSADSRSYPFSYTVSSANTWTSISIAIAGDTTGTWIGATNGVGLKLNFSLGCGSDLKTTAGAWTAGYYESCTGSVNVVGTNGATFYITGVQLEVGSTATSFDYRPYGTELQLCQRYYTQSNLQTAAANLFSSTYSVYVTSWNYSGTAWIGQAQRFPVTMRTIPTCALYTANIAQNSSAGNVSFYQGSWIVSGAAVHASTNESYLGFATDSTGAGSTGSNLIQMNYTASAEL